MVASDSPSKAQEFNKNRNISQPKNLTHLQEQKPGWSQWKTWKNFPHDQIQLGFSNSDYGSMMDLEYKCFNQVGSENDEKKYQTYWYRIAEQKEPSKYLKIEVGCLQNNQFTATSIVNGLFINYNSSSSSNIQFCLIKSS
ncbi:hypothetical protein [Crocosphaera sp. Alani8]|uniref:hypothetical protein n=1 Tax=Crocosphaera sp. Alani8 TaxID=3038952 RepID=UPI00313DD584